MGSPLECPRCHRPIGQLELPRALGPFRSAGTAAEPPSIPRCGDCELTLFEKGISSVAGRGVARLTGSAHARNSVEAPTSCPKCLASLMRVTVEVDRKWVEVEECVRCGLLVVDDGELRALVELIAAGKSLPWLDVELSDEASDGEYSSLADLLPLFWSWSRDRPPV